MFITAFTSITLFSRFGKTAFNDIKGREINITKTLKTKSININKTFNTCLIHDTEETINTGLFIPKYCRHNQNKTTDIGLKINVL